MTWFDDMACDECLLDYITQVCGDVARSFWSCWGRCLNHVWDIEQTPQQGREFRFERQDVFFVPVSIWRRTSTTNIFIHWATSEWYIERTGECFYLVNHVDDKRAAFPNSPSQHPFTLFRLFPLPDASGFKKKILHATPTGILQTRWIEGTDGQATRQQAVDIPLFIYPMHWGVSCCHHNRYFWKFAAPWNPESAGPKGCEMWV